jgi:hypothetical protein
VVRGFVFIMLSITGLPGHVCDRTGPLRMCDRCQFNIIVNKAILGWIIGRYHYMHIYI